MISFYCNIFSNISENCHPPLHKYRLLASSFCQKGAIPTVTVEDPLSALGMYLKNAIAHSNIQR